MEAKLIINNVDFSPWIIEGGLQHSKTYRQARDVVTLDGTLYRAQVVKRTIGVSLVEMRGTTLATLKAALVNPATVQFTDPDTGNLLTAVFYVSDPSEEAKTVTGGNTYYSGASFTLEER